MSSFYEDASLVMIPSGYKTSKVYSAKPTDGAGDLSFTRSNDTATRVNSAGLIEKVRTNLFTYSEQLDNAAWTKADTTIVANAVANPLNGAVTADKMTDASTATAARYIYQSPASSGTIYTSSGYFKKAEYNFVTLHAFGLNGAVFNLDTGVKVSQSGGVGNITSVGNGWYRCTFTFTAGGSSVFFSQSPAGLISYAGTTGSGIYAFGLQVETGDIATDYIATTSAAVSVGPVANVPRLDYLNSSCPRLLLEPQRTNLLQYSEQFDNAYWGKLNTTVDSNVAISPDGYTNADRLKDDTVSGSHYASSSAITVTNATQYTFTAYLKADTLNWARLELFGGGCFFDLSNGTLGTASGATATITSVGSGWYRCSVMATSASTTAYPSIRLTTGNGVFGYVGNGSGVFVWGAQLELGAYATSYIPTLGAAVTRGADAASKTGISSLIGQTEGTLFVDFIASAQNQDGASYSCITIFGTNTENMQLYTLGTTLRWYALKSAIIFDQTADQTLVAGQRYKVAFAYKSGDWALYINGVQKRTRTETSVPATSQFNFNTDSFGAGNAKVENKFAQTLIFKTRLTNAQMQELTSL